jgi:hypothetical protein
VTAPVQAERFLLVLQLLNLRPTRNLAERSPLRRTGRAVVVAAEELRLPQVVVALRPHAVVARRVDRGE